MEDDRKMSFFSPPITNKYPNGETTIAVVKELIRSTKLKPMTEMVRKGEANKNDVCPWIISTGVYSYGNDAGIEKFSGCPSIDIDHTSERYGLDPETVKRLLAADKVLNFNLLNISVSGTGVKGILTVKGSTKEGYDRNYRIIEKYILDTYGIKIDPACRNISRAYYLSYDPDVYYNADGFVEQETLNMLEKEEVHAEGAEENAKDTKSESFRVSKSQGSKDLTTKGTEENAKDAKRATVKECPYEGGKTNSTGAPEFSAPDYSTGERPSDRLNRLQVIHDLAVEAVKRIGWKQKSEETWTRAGKDPKEGCSAIWNVWDKEGIWIFTCFTTNGLPFKANKGYSDTQILCIINYRDNWMDCISDLAARFL